MKMKIKVIVKMMHSKTCIIQVFRMFERKGLFLDCYFWKEV